MAWKAVLIFEDGDELVVDGDYDSSDDALDAGRIAASNYRQGNSYLEMAGEDYSDDAIKRIKVYKE